MRTCWRRIRIPLALLFFLPVLADERQESIRRIFAENRDPVVLVSYRVHASDDPNSPAQDQRIAGVLVDAKGLVMVSGLPFPEQVPVGRYDQFTVAPSEGRIQVKARFLGRGKIPQVAFLRITEPEKLAKMPVLAFQEGELQLADEVLLISPTIEPGRQVFHVAMCNQILEGGGVNGWKTSATTYPGCPVLSLDGKAIGVVSTSNLADPQQNFVLSAKDFLASISDPPTAPQPASSPTGPAQRSQRGWLGLSFQTLDSSDLAEDFGLPADSGGIVVTTVIEDSPAARAGLRIGDVILTVKGTEVKRAPGPQMVAMVQGLFGQIIAGQEVVLGFWRDGKRQDMRLKAATPPLPSAQAPRQAYPAFGFVVRELVLEDRMGMRLSKEQKGVVCIEVGNSTWAADSGLRPGDVVQRVDEEEVENLAAFQKAFAGVVERRPARVFLGVLRGGRDTLTLKLEPHW